MAANRHRGSATDLPRSARGALFWLGIAAIVAGVALHLPMYFESAAMGYRMVGMPMDLPMKIGMGLIVVGTVLAAVGLTPVRPIEPIEAAPLRHVMVVLDDARIRPAHVGLLLTLATAVTIDVMKPTTLAFVLPGMTAEYGLAATSRSGAVPAVLLPVSALTGMVLGALLWGEIGDRMGRRASVVLAGVMFIGTSICGAMPSFGWNLVMCFLMGVAVGGMLPIAFALLAETIPARHRSWLLVLIGGDVAGSYILVSGLSSVLEPHFGWRVMWLIGLPSGVLMILLSRWLPESPRFLLLTGREAEARAVMAKFGAELVQAEAPAPVIDFKAGYGQLLRRPLRWLTGGIALFGLGWGLVNNGFLLWLPSNLRAAGLPAASADRLLAGSALLGLPAIFVVAFLYGFWSSKKTMAICATVTAADLLVFAILGDGVADHRALLRILVLVLIAGTSSVLATLTPYAAEIFPTQLRGRGTGFANMSARAGGLLSVLAVLAGVATPTFAGSALLGAVPMTLGALCIAVVGVETRRRRVEQIASELLA